MKIDEKFNFCQGKQKHLQTAELVLIIEFFLIVPKRGVFFLVG